MGRSVSYPSNTAALTFTHLDSGDDPEDVDAAQWAWDDFIENLKAAVAEAFKPVAWWPIDKWRDEDHGILACDYGYFGVSEYCGLVSVWIVPADEEEDEDGAQALARQHFLEGAQEKLEQALAYTNGDENVLVKTGTFSNGEGVYRRKEVKREGKGKRRKEARAAS